jgi:membrane-associated phospholipid phosphatase
MTQFAIFRFRAAALLGLATGLAGCSRIPDTDPRLVSEWMHTLYGVVRAERISPPIASRFMAYAAVALYEGLAAAPSGSGSMAGTLNGLNQIPAGTKGRRYDGTLVAVAAEQVVTDSLLAEALPATRATLANLVDSLNQTRVALGIDDEVREQSAELGRRIGLAVVAWSRSDGFDSTRGRPYKPPTGPGLWINDTPGNLYAPQNLSAATDFVGLDNPANNARPGTTSDRGLIMNRPKRTGLKALPPVNMAGATEPYWGSLRPFVLKSWIECPIPDPPAFSTEPGTPLYQEALAVAETGKRLTAEQRTTAFYWADNAGETGTPVGHWIAIASQMVSQRNLPANAAARLFVLSATAQADAFIAAWGYKYRFNLIRPRTYIRRIIDPKWEPLIPTPPFPEYPSAHSTQSSAAATALTAMLGEVAFDDSSGVAIGPAIQRFNSFTEAALAAGKSRVYGGIHFEAGNQAGRTVGSCIGARVAERLGAAPAQ